ncbi:polysaccharide biosynthesis/export family protein [Rhizobium sp. C4]|uniref:polysaccharide biosynthesis/export family protein n=1 Tax=Rhizobium sp. C4 TaxID=1349800 RepID=UPI001E532E7C|nr:polysaccharide biosynthesis/export family protein [Rhizobium sp. C4]MCD2171628.1 polysaccharide export protein [Rhizobium sp. C4]
MPLDLSRRKFIFVSLALTAPLAACNTTAPASGEFSQSLMAPYRLDSGDRLRITVFDQPSLTNTYSVDQSGYIAFPLIGSVVARGKTMQELEVAIAAQLRKGYLRDPDVTVEVDRYRPIYVMGEVGQPGQYSYAPGMTVQNAVAAAGGFTPRALQSGADITRKLNGRVLTGRVAITDAILAGDTIYVRERLF